MVVWCGICVVCGFRFVVVVWAWSGEFVFVFRCGWDVGSVVD